MLLLDTDVLIDIQRGNAAAIARFSGLTDLPSVSGFVIMELIQGAQNSKQVRDVLKLVAPLSVVWPGELDCQKALADFTALHLSHGLGLLDSLVAACAVGVGAELFTFNDKHFRMVPKLTTVRPYARS